MGRRWLSLAIFFLFLLIMVGIKQEAERVMKSVAYVFWKHWKTAKNRAGNLP